MKLNLQSLNRRDEWKALGVRLPEYDVAAMAERTRRAPIWAHFGAGNLFRGYVAMLQQSLLNHGLADQGVIAVDTSADGELTRRVYLPHDNLTLRIALRGDGSTDAEIAAAVAEAVRADFSDADCFSRLREIFRSPSLQMVSFTITEKGYALRAADGKLLPEVEADLKNGPDRAANVMAKAAALLLERFRAGALPVAMVSMDNCSRNGEKLRDAVRFIARGWIENGFAPAEFADYLADETRVSFPWTMIDKIVPRPDAEIARQLAERGIEGMEILPRARGAAVAPFVNAETAEYLVVEDSFPAGRPPLERAGVRMTDRATVSLCERMKVTACLNPLHTALAVLGCALGESPHFRRDGRSHAAGAGRAHRRGGPAHRRASGHSGSRGVPARAADRAPAQPEHSRHASAHRLRHQPEGAHPLWRNPEGLCRRGHSAGNADGHSAGHRRMDALSAGRGRRIVALRTQPRPAPCGASAGAERR